MRRLVVLVLLAVGCEARYGAYFTIEGDVEFQNIELYFGVQSASDQFATPVLGPQTGTVFDRVFSPSDLAAAGGRSTSYWIPYSEDNAKLGAYVAVVATKRDDALGRDTPVGIAELFDFAVPEREVYQYRLELAPYAQQLVDRWGQPGCIAWLRARDGASLVTAVVLPNDRDCDNVAAMLDCNDLCVQGSASCPDPRSLCASMTTCSLGCSVEGVCAPKTCVPPIACSQCLNTGNDLASKLDCMFDFSYTHIEINVDAPNGTPCTTHFVVDPGLPCKQAMLEHADSRLTDGYTFAVSDDGTKCLIDLVKPVANTGFFGEHHLLISFAEDTAVRSSFVIGIQPSTNQVCQSTGYVVVPGSTVATCR